MNTPSPTRRRAQIRRWRLAFLALVVVGLALPWQLALYQRHRIVSEVERLNGLATCRYRFQLPWVRMRFEFGPVETVYLVGPKTNDDTLAVLGCVPGLRILMLTDTHVTDRGLAQLSEFPELNYISLGSLKTTTLNRSRGASVQISDSATGRGLEALKDLPKLEVIQLIGANTTDADLKSLAKLKRLVFVDLYGTSVTAAGLAELKAALPACKIGVR